MQSLGGCTDPVHCVCSQQWRDCHTLSVTDLSDCKLALTRQQAWQKVHIEKAYIKDDKVEEDKEDVHHDPHDQLQLADNPPGVLQGVRQILTLLIDLHM